MKKILLVVLVLLLVMTPCLLSVIYAQPVPPAKQGCPIDGGALILLSMAVLYGIRKLFKAGKNSN